MQLIQTILSSSADFIKDNKKNKFRRCRKDSRFNEDNNEIDYLDVQNCNSILKYLNFLIISNESQRPTNLLFTSNEDISIQEEKYEFWNVKFYKDKHFTIIL